MNRFYQGDWIDSMASRFIDELPENNLEKILILRKIPIHLTNLNLIKMLILMKIQKESGLDKIPKKNQMIKERLKKLKVFKKYNLDGYVVPKNDEFFEFSNKDRLKIISNLGSVGYVVI